jgi:WD40 repeat protein
MASGGSDGRIMLWNPERHIRVGILSLHGATPDDRNVTSVAFGPGGHLLASGAFDGVVTLWNVDQQIQVGTSRVPSPVSGACWMSVAFSHDGRMLAAVAADGTVTLWDVEHRAPMSTRQEPDTGTTSNLVFSPDGRTLAVGGSEVVVWDVNRRWPCGTLLAVPRKEPASPSARRHTSHGSATIRRSYFGTSAATPASAP